MTSVEKYCVEGRSNATAQVPSQFPRDPQAPVQSIIIVNSPGCCSPDLISLRFVRKPRPRFPFDEFEHSPSEWKAESVRSCADVSLR